VPLTEVRFEIDTATYSPDGNTVWQVKGEDAICAPLLIYSNHGVRRLEWAFKEWGDRPVDPKCPLFLSVAIIFNLVYAPEYGNQSVPRAPYSYDG